MKGNRGKSYSQIGAKTKEKIITSCFYSRGYDSQKNSPSSQKHILLLGNELVQISSGTNFSNEKKAIHTFYDSLRLLIHLQLWDTLHRLNHRRPLQSIVGQTSLAK